MITFFQAIFLGLLQGVTELFPVSSLGHSIIVPAVLGWQLGQDTNFYLMFLVATHLATSLVLLGFFWSDWVLIVKGLVRVAKKQTIEAGDTYAKLGMLLIIGTFPAGILGLLFQKKLESLFSAPEAVAFFLLLNGVLLYGAELLKRKAARKEAVEVKDEMHSDARIAKLSWKQAVQVGCAQALALLPGFSRTGATLGGGLLVGLSHKDAARFSFLLATPIILAAAVLKLPGLFHGPRDYSLMPVLVGAIAAAVGAFFSIKFLTKYFDNKTLTPFALYCIIAGLLAFLFLLLNLGGSMIA